MLNNFVQSTPAQHVYSPKKAVSGSSVVDAAETLTVIGSIPVGIGEKYHFVAKATASDTGGALAAYEVKGCVANKAGTVALVGSVSVLAFEDDTDWAFTLTANNTDKTLEVKATSDATLVTTFVWSVELFLM